MSKRYPYTYAADYIRSLAGSSDGSTKLSRSDASFIRASIANVLGMDDEQFAKQLADHYMRITNETSARESSSILHKLR